MKEEDCFQTAPPQGNKTQQANGNPNGDGEQLNRVGKESGSPLMIALKNCGCDPQDSIHTFLITITIGFKKILKKNYGLISILVFSLHFFYK